MSRIKHNAMMDTFKRDDPNHDRDEDEDKVREIPYTLFKLGIVRKEPKDPIRAHLRKLEPQQTLVVDHHGLRSRVPSPSKCTNFAYLMSPIGGNPDNRRIALPDNETPKQFVVYQQSSAMFTIKRLKIETRRRQGDAIENSHVTTKKISGYGETAVSILDKNMGWKDTVRSLVRAGFCLIDSLPSSTYRTTRCWVAKLPWSVSNVPERFGKHIDHNVGHESSGSCGRKFQVFGGRMLPFLSCGGHHRLDAVLCTGIVADPKALLPPSRIEKHCILCNGCPAIEVTGTFCDAPGNVDTMCWTKSEASNLFHEEFSATIHDFQDSQAAMGRDPCNGFARLLSRYVLDKEERQNRRMKGRYSSRQRLAKQRRGDSEYLGVAKVLSHFQKLDAQITFEPLL
jgi:hypothetical protein